MTIRGSAHWFNAEPRRSILYLGALILVKLVLQSYLYAAGFVSVAADEVSRGIRAAEWALKPHLDVLADVRDPWLPFEKYLNGTLLMVWPNVLWAPRATTFVASCVVLIALYLLVYFLFGSFRVAALAGIFVVFEPWYTWLSGTPMLEMYYLACFFSGLLLLLVWLRHARPWFWLWAGMCFALSSGFHFQSWTFINVVNVLTLGFLYQFIARKQTTRALQLVGFYFVGNAFIIAFTLIEFATTGHLLTFLANHSSYSKWFYGGYTVSVASKLLYYPRLILQNSNDASWVLALAGVFFLARGGAEAWTLIPLGIAALALCMNSIVNVASVPATAAPDRFALFYVLLLSPYLAYGADRIWQFGKRWSPSLAAYAPAVLAAGLYLCSLSWGLRRIQYFPQGVSTDAVATGYALHQWLDRTGQPDPSTYMVELKYWDFLGVELTAGHYDAVVLDREYDPRNRGIASIFSDHLTDVRERLRAQRVRYLALHDPHSKTAAGRMPFLTAKQDVGAWTIYEFNP
jgi:hypothetical protein